MSLRKKLATAGKSVRKFITPATPWATVINRFGYGTSVVGAYEKSAVAYSCIRRISQDISGAPLLFLADPDNIDSSLPESHPIVKLFKNPNVGLSQKQFLEYFSMWLHLRGESFVVFDDYKNPTKMIPTVDPLSLTTIKGPKHSLVGYRINMGDWAERWMPHEILHHRFINPSNPWRGLSPLESAGHALNIDVQGDQLASDIVDRGGESGLVYKTEEEYLPEQQEEMETKLKARRDGRGRIPKDMLLSGGMDIADPKFTSFDYRIFERMPDSMKKIAMVYGMSLSLLGEDSEPNYSTFEGRIRIYWQQTLMPTIGGIESAFDSHFGKGLNPVFVRWNREKIPGLQADTKVQSETAKIMRDSGLPWTVIDSKLNLDLPLDEIPGADEVMVPATMAPLSQLIADWQYLPAETSVNIAASRGPGLSKGLTNKEIKRRMTDPAAIAQRDRKLGRLERAVSRSWRSLHFKYRKQVLAAWNKSVEETATIESAATKFRSIIEPMLLEKMAEDAVSDIQPRQISAGEVGESSIETVATRSLIYDGLTTKQGKLSEETLNLILARENEIVALTDGKLFEPIMDEVYRVVWEQGEVGEVQTIVQQSLDAQKAIKATFNASANRAKTIARQEVGTAFNVGRFNEMETQFGSEAKHEWIAVGDEDTRETHLEAAAAGPIKIGELFPGVELAYPQDPSGPAEEVINCRCLTMPVLEEDQ